MKKLLPIIIGLAVMAFAAWAAMNGQSNTSTQNNTQNASSTTETSSSTTPTTPITSQPTTPKEKGITSVEVATHNSQSSCWSIVNGTVYDLTNWIMKHPGGQKAILGICGKDGTTAFTGQHGGQEKPEQILASFKIGVLSN